MKAQKKAAGPRQVPKDQPLWALLKQYCHAVTTLTDLSGSYSYCNTTLDQIGTCWPRSAAGVLVERPCPEYFNGVKYNTTRNAYRECLENGTWASRINYSQCEPILDEKQRKYDLHYRIALAVNYLGHCISVAALVAAFLLFLALRSIRCLRNVIHWNLITTFILRNVMWFLLQLINHEVHESNEVWCRCITTIFNYFVVTNFFWMFVEGIYLHTAIVMTYSTERLPKWLFLFIGWCVPCPIIITWAIGKLYYENEQCWFGKEPGDLVDYIYQGPIIFVLLINFVFLFNIVRILMTKLRASSASETIQYRVSLYLSSTASSMERYVRLLERGGTAGRTIIPSESLWLEPCPSPHHPHESASIASSKQPLCDPRPCCPPLGTLLCRLWWGREREGGDLHPSLAGERQCSSKRGLLTQGQRGPQALCSRSRKSQESPKRASQMSSGIGSPQPLWSVPPNAPSTDEETEARRGKGQTCWQPGGGVALLAALCSCGEEFPPE
ncbi:corticotropin-releasing factor receptor 2 isoform X3 [Nycticebus coucang]|uniref:corticotropin-releasing factor receptor 2 isoform X3 n=1 Tax=Nycticebus coucang TaxID=9470 RepID=UPI00234C2370|nr:corticotropin-releasing factor receptor 2 isoform X3 [Nycticebus coucang]